MNLALCLWMLVTAQGRLVGTVVDAATKAPLADVLVTVTGPGSGETFEVVTAVDGSYSVPVPPGRGYTIVFESADYKKSTRSGLIFRPDASVRVNVDLLPALLTEEEVVLNCRFGPIDLSSSSTGVHISTDFIRNAAGLMGPRGSK